MGMEAGVLKRFWLIVAIVAGGLPLVSAGPAPVVPHFPLEQSDLDTFMKRVVAKRDDNWKKFQQYVLDEREQVEFRGPVKIPL